MEEKRQGMLLVISGPSGVGKGTLLNRLFAEDSSFVFSVSATTRGPRTGEVDGVHYHFMDRPAFDALVAQDAFVEHAEVHGNCYGTLKSEVLSRMEQGQNVVLDIDTQGALSVMDSGLPCVTVFILPPSFTELERRLVNRGTETPEVIARRMANARHEVTLLPRYDYALVNDDLDAAYTRLRAITLAEMQRVSRYCPSLDD